MKTLFSSDKKNIMNRIEDTFGIKKVPQLMVRFGKEKIRIFSGNISTKELGLLDKNINIETVGLYAFKEQIDDIRLTIDGLAIFQDQITKNILEISDEDTIEWFKGNDLDIKTDNSFKILKNKNDFIGCGKSTGERITNFMPKERRIKDHIIK